MLIYGTLVTTNMQAHLQTKHTIIIKQELSLIQATTTQQLQQLYL
jgi:hypothetical protein